MAPVLLLLLACEPDHSGEGIQGALTRARLESVELATFFLFGGGVGGEGTMVVRDQAEELFEAPVSFDGVLVGGVVEISVAFAGPVAMYLPDAKVEAADLFSVYTGVATSVSAVPGIATHHLENERGVQIDVAMFELGIGVRVAFEALGITQEATFKPVEGNTDSDTGDDTGDAS